MRPYYAAISPDGKILGIEENAESALKVVERKVGGSVAVQYLSEPRGNPGPNLSSQEMLDLAIEHAMISPISESAVEAMELEEAHGLLLPYFEGIEKRGQVVKKYNTPSGMADAWIGDNYKTSKPSQDEGRPVEVMGLTLVPAKHARQAGFGKDMYERIFDITEAAVKRAAKDRGVAYKPKMYEDAKKSMAEEKPRMLARWANPSTGMPQRVGSDAKFNWCQGSSQECRDSCLIYAGQNASERYNSYRKIAQAHALLGQPTAFMRILMQSIDQWLTGCSFYKRPDPKQEVTPMFRLNVLSDIPWEQIAPWLFARYKTRAGENGKTLRWYDYTKVPGRRGWSGFPSNYDLTFSLSGTNPNEQYAIEEIERYNSRIAVVFLGYKKDDGTWQTLLDKGEEAQKNIPLPKTFTLGKKIVLPVTDGDKSDARPWDDQRVAVGLRWKIPSGKRSGVETQYEMVDIEGEKIERMKMSFVTPIYIKSRKESSYTPNPDDDDVVMISAVTPRQEPIIQHLSQPF